MNLSFRHTVVGIAVLSLGLSGCGESHPAYSSNVKYGLRKDPILQGLPKDLGDDRYTPDRPNVFPVMKVADFSEPEHPYFAKSKGFSDKIFRDPTLVPAKEQKELEAALETMFGTPANPIVNAKEAGVDESVLKELQLDNATLAKGSTRYRIHCLHCHGVAGDGRGPTARWINPHPRDFREGLFKFMSIDQTNNTGLPPARADLMRTLRHGIEGTAMPTFNLLADDELESLVSYVIHLSIRGKAERTTIVSAFDFEPKANALELVQGAGNMKQNVKDFTAKFVNGWAKSNTPEAAIQVAKYPFDEKDPNYLTEILPASVRRGQQIFTASPSEDFQNEHAKKIYPKIAKDAEEAAHAQKIADAEQKKRDEAKKKNDKLTDDDLEKIKLSTQEVAALKKLTAKEMGEIMLAAEKLAGDKALSTLKGANCVSCHTNYGRQAMYRFDQWGTLVRPNNLTQGNYRGGRRPVDNYYRIHSGINGSGMTPFGTTFKDHEQYIWDLVNFVQSLPYPEMRRSLKLRIE